ncbi:MAG: helix-turn-helix domain-containing protein [Clostridia bacterium]|nr:helix-turn-helix domain-containing protein [Clostridia bacterium]
MREKNGYRDELENIREVFGADVNTLTVEQTARFLGVERRTVSRLIKRKKDPLPAKNVGCGSKPAYSISITALARWRCG